MRGEESKAKGGKVNYIEAFAVIVGVILFLWASAVVATGLSFLVTDGRLGRREWYQIALAVAIIFACTVGIIVLDMDATLLPPEMDPAAPAP
jgi:hypothetical protein